VLYWCLVFPFSTSSLRALSVFTHGVNFAVMLLDGWLSRQPYLISHGVYFLAYCLIYLVWSIIHSVANLKNADEKEYIYAVLDWRQSSSKAAMYAVAVVIIAAPLVNLFFWWLLHYQRRHLDHPESGDGSYLNSDADDRSRGRPTEIELGERNSHQDNPGAGAGVIVGEENQAPRNPAVAVPTALGTPYAAQQMSMQSV
jgi:hypothetical protein